jgi:phosphatidylinositol alpha-1,6-mannosyltransferase
MRVLWITGNFLPEIGGLQVYTESLTDALSRHCEVGLVTGAQHTPPVNPVVAHYAVANITAPGDYRDWEQAQTQLASAVFEFRPDIIHLANANVAVYRHVFDRSLPVVATVHGNDLTAPWQRVPGRNTLRCICDGLNACDRLLAVSRHTGGLVAEYGITAPLSVLHSGCDLDFFSPGWSGSEATREQYGIPPDVPILLTVGRLVPRKGHLVILEALRRISTSVYWIIVGVGPMRERLISSIRNSDLIERALITGEVSKEELRSLYQACDIFVLTPEEQRIGDRLDSEGFGLVFLEAGACGKPVIGSDISGCREAVIDGQTGVMVPPGDPNALAEAIDRLLTDPELAGALGMEGLASVRAGGGWLRLAHQVKEIYQELVADTRSEQALLRFYRV